MHRLFTTLSALGVAAASAGALGCSSNDSRTGAPPAGVERTRRPRPISVGVQPSDLTTSFKPPAVTEATLQFNGLSGDLGAIDWYAVAASVSVVSDSGDPVPCNVVALPPLMGNPEFKPATPATRASSRGVGPIGSQTSRQSNVAMVDIQLETQSLPDSAWLLLSVDLPSEEMVTAGFAPADGGRRRSVRLGVGSMPTVRAVSVLRGSGAAGQPSKVGFGLSEPVRADILSKTFYAAIDGVPCVPPAAGGEEASTWVLECEAAPGKHVVAGAYRVGGQPAGLALGRGEERQEPPFELAAELGGEASVSLYPVAP